MFMACILTMTYGVLGGGANQVCDTVSNEQQINEERPSLLADIDIVRRPRRVSITAIETTRATVLRQKKVNRNNRSSSDDKTRNTFTTYEHNNISKLNIDTSLSMPFP